MKPPLLLLLLLVAGFVSCIPRERQEGDAKDSLAPPSAGDSRGGLSLALIKDADQQLSQPLPSDGGADDDYNYQTRNDLKEPNPVQTQGEKKVSSDALTRNLRMLRYRKTPTRNTASRRGRFGGRGRSGQELEDDGEGGRSGQDLENYGADSYDFQQNDEDDNFDEEEEGMEMNEEEDYGEDDEDGSDVANFDDEEEEEDYQPRRRAPPKRRRRKPRRGNKGRKRGRYLRDLEGHEDTKRGYEDYSDSDDDDETRPLLRGSRNSTKRASSSPGRNKYYIRSGYSRDNAKKELFSKLKAVLKKKKPSRSSIKYQRLRDSDKRDGDEDKDQNITKRGLFSRIKDVFKRNKTAKAKSNKYQRLRDSDESVDRGYDDYGYDGGNEESQDITKRGLFSKVKSWFKKKKPAKTNTYQRLRSNERFDDGGYDNDGGDETYEGEEIDYDGATDDKKSLLPRRRSGFRDSSRRYRNKRGDLDLVERVLRNVALISSRLKDDVALSTATPPLLLDTLKEELQEDQDKNDEGGEGDKDEEEVKGKEYDNGVDENEENGRQGNEYDVGDEYEVESEGNKDGVGECETQNGDYDAWDKQNGQKDEYEINGGKDKDDEYEINGGKDKDDEYEGEGEDEGSEVDGNDEYDTKDQGTKKQNSRYRSSNDIDKGRNDEDDSYEDYDDSDEYDDDK